MFLHESWPWCKGQPAILSVSENGIAKVRHGFHHRQLKEIRAFDCLLCFHKLYSNFLSNIKLRVIAVP